MSFKNPAGLFAFIAIIFSLTACGGGTSDSTDNTIKYNIVTSASPSFGGTISGSGNYDSDQLVTLTASPNTGYTFINWTEGSAEVSTSTSYTFTATEDRTLVANYNALPMVDPGLDKSIYEKDLVILNGSADDVDGSVVGYSWNQLSGVSVTLNDSGTQNSSFTAPSVNSIEILTFELLVVDDLGATNSSNISVKVHPLVDVSGSILADTVLSMAGGPYEVTALLSVAPGVTLTIEPGALLRFHPGVKLAVAGTLLAQGTAVSPVFFSSLSNDTIWAGIELVDSSASVFEYAVIEYASRAIDLNGVSTPTIRNNVFRNNGWVITDTSGYQTMQVENNTFSNNMTAFAGIRTIGTSTFSGNLFTNTPNIFEWGYYFDTTIVVGNSFLGSLFVVRAPEVGFGYGTVIFGNNWWDTIDTAEINSLIFDLYDDATLQEVSYLPILTEEPTSVGSPISVSIPLPQPQ